MRGASGGGTASEEEALRAKLTGFLHMVSPTVRTSLTRGEHVLRAGDQVDAFYVLDEGELQVSEGGGGSEGGFGVSDAALVCSDVFGEGVGEVAVE